MFTLIANSGIQFLKTEIELNPNDDVVKALRFWQPLRKTVLLEYAEYLSEEDKWVSRASLKKQCYLDENGKIDKSIPLNINELEVVDADNEGYAVNNIETNIHGGLYRDKSAIQYFENCWFPVPYFEQDAID